MCSTSFMAILIDSEIFCVQSQQFVLRFALKEIYGVCKTKRVHPLRNMTVNLCNFNRKFYCHLDIVISCAKVGILT